MPFNHQLQIHDYLSLLVLVGFLAGAGVFLHLLREIHKTTLEIHQAMYRMLRILDIELRGEGEDKLQ
jgi:hypothetical protein